MAINCDGRESNKKVFHRNRKRWNYVFILYDVNQKLLTMGLSWFSNQRYSQNCSKFYVYLVTFSYAIEVVVRYGLEREYHDKMIPHHFRLNEC